MTTHRIVRLFVALAVLIPAAAWGAGILSSFRLSAHHPLKGGYVLSDLPSEPLGTPVTPDPSRNYNISGQLNTVTRIATGFYQVTFPVLGHRPGTSAAFGGNVAVTAIYNFAPVSCMTQGWETFFADPDAIVYVDCINTTTGAAADSPFSVLLTF